MKTVVLAVLTLTAATALAAPPACSPKQVIAQHVQWLNGSKNNVVRVTAVSNQNNRVVSYAEGDLTMTGTPFPGTNAPSYLGGTLNQFFNDRKFDLPRSGGVSIARYPFSPTSTDKISMNITSDGAIALALKSWNNSVLNLTDVQCAAGVLYGFTDNSSGPRSFYLISLGKGSSATPSIK